MYQIAYVLSSKIYFSENVSRPTHYNMATKARELQWKRIIHVVACTVRQLAGRSIIQVTVPIPKDIKYRRTKIKEKLFTITEISRRLIILVTNNRTCYNRPSYMLATGYRRQKSNLFILVQNILSARGSNVCKMNNSLYYLLSLIISHNNKRLHPSDLNFFILLMVFQTSLMQDQGQAWVNDLCRVRVRVRLGS